MTTCEFCAGTIHHKALGATLRVWRTRLGIKMAWMAISMNITNTYLSQLELGKRSCWSRRLMERFCDVCEEEQTRLLGEATKGIV